MPLIGTYLKELRKSEKLTCASAAEMLGVTKAFISMVENHKRIPQVDYLKRASNVYKADLHVLVARALYTEFLNKIELYNSPLDLTLKEIDKCIQEKRKKSSE